MELREALAGIEPPPGRVAVIERQAATTRRGARRPGDALTTTSVRSVRLVVLVGLHPDLAPKGEDHQSAQDDDMGKGEEEVEHPDRDGADAERYTFARARTTPVGSRPNLLTGMEATDSTSEDPLARVAAFLGSLETEVNATGAGEWTIVLEAGGHRLDIAVTIRGPFLRAEAAVLPAGLLNPHQLLFWNRQAPLVCFAESAEGEVLVCGELPLESIGSETLDRFFGLLLASAARAREFVLRPTPP